MIDPDNKPEQRQKSVAVILMNMGGPDTQNNVRGFLRKLFSDPAIIQLPFGFRHLLAELISRTREKKAKKNYALMGGGSPILAETKAQQQSLLVFLQKKHPYISWQVEIAMRYTKPGTRQAFSAVQKAKPQQVICLPLYPQFSSTTSGSSFNEWRKTDKNCNWKTSYIKSYATATGFIAANIQVIMDQLAKTSEPAIKKSKIRVLFSAHGLPEKLIAAGDPYQKQVEETAAAIARQLPNELDDWQVCYQSKVGPLDWIGPSLEEEIKRAAINQKGVLVVPLSFVSEHIETLVELDIQYKDMATELGLPCYLRASTVRTNAEFIEQLAALVYEQTKTSGNKEA